MSTIKETKSNKATQDIHVASFSKRSNWEPFFFLLCSSKCEFSHEILKRSLLMLGHNLSFTSYQMKFTHECSWYRAPKSGPYFHNFTLSCAHWSMTHQNFFQIEWDNFTKHNQSQKNWSMHFVRPLWRRSNNLITCAQSSVKSQIKWPELNSFQALGKIMNSNHN